MYGKHDHSHLKSMFSALTGVVVGFVLSFISFHYDKTYGSNPCVYISEKPISSTPEESEQQEYNYQNRNDYSESEAGTPRVLCLVMTYPDSHDKKAIYVKNTWGKRCDKLIFMSSANDEKLGAIDLKLNVTSESRHILWGKTKKGFQYAWEHHREEADWFMKADDDTYVILENLKAMLKNVDPRKPVYYGARFDFKGFQHGYMSGGSGYTERNLAAFGSLSGHGYGALS